MTTTERPGTGSADRARWIPLAGSVNTRDLGGLPAAGGVIAERVLLRSDNLQDLTPADVALLHDEVGLRLVVDLRTGYEADNEGASPLQAAGDVRHLQLSLIPEAGPDVPPEPRAADAASLLLPDRWARGAVGAYQRYLSDRPEAFVAVARALGDPASGAAVIHCAAGKDRTGVMVAVLLDTVGVPTDVVVGDFEATNARVPRIIDRLLDRPIYREGVLRTGADGHYVEAATMRAVLAGLQEQWGGSAGYLTAHGLTDDELTALRARLVQPTG